MEHNQVNWGRPRDDVYGAYDINIHNAGHNYQAVQEASMIPKTNTQSPIITGTSVIGIKFNKGVILAADNLGMLK